MGTRGMPRLSLSCGALKKGGIHGQSDRGQRRRQCAARHHRPGRDLRLQPRGAARERHIDRRDPRCLGIDAAAVRRLAAGRPQPAFHRRENGPDQNSRSGERRDAGHAVPQCRQRNIDCRRAGPAWPHLRSGLRRKRIFLRQSDQHRRRHRNPALSGFSGQSQPGRSRKRDPDHPDRSAGRHQSQGRMARLRPRRLSLRGAG